MGMVSECCCKEVYIIIIDILIIINTFPYSTCINSFFGSIIPISLFIFKCFFCTCNIYCRVNASIMGRSELWDTCEFLAETKLA